MKTLHLKYLLVILFCAIFCNCENDDDTIELPKLTVNSSVASNPFAGSAGDSIDYEIEAETPANFDGFKIIERKESIETIIYEETHVSNPSLNEATSYNKVFSYTLTESSSVIKLIFIVTDQAGNDVSQERIIEIL